MTVSFTLDGGPCEADDDGGSLLDALRDQLGARSPKDGCSPQGQCGCCTVLVDGQPRVACVTPLRRVAGREVTTVDGLAPTERRRWAEAFCATGASQCGFCTPGIVVRLEGLRRRGVAVGDHGAVEQALLAHLCRCTGWRTILEAWDLVAADGEVAPGLAGRDPAAAAERAALEGGVAQLVAPEVALGGGGFADDLAPSGALVAVPVPVPVPVPAARPGGAGSGAGGGWAVGPTRLAARRAAGQVPGRHTTQEPRPPLDLPEGRWDVTLQTGWVEPAYLETDASWCAPGGGPASPLGNGGAFGGKADSPVAAAARQLADEQGLPVRLLWSREDTVRLGPKRPPMAAGVDRAAGRVVVRLARTPGVAEALAAGLGPGVDLRVEEVDVAGPPTSGRLRAAGWAEGVVLRAALAEPPPAGGADPSPSGGGGGEGGGGEGRGGGWIVAPGGARARAGIDADGTVRVGVDAGRPLDEVVLRSYCLGAAHMALGWVTSEGIAVGDDGVPVDLTIRSFGVLRAVDTPPIEVVVEPSDGPPRPVADVVFAAVAAATWAAQGFPPVWPTGHRLR